MSTDQIQCSVPEGNIQIVFFGSVPFSVIVLEKLLNAPGLPAGRQKWVEVSL